MSCPDWRRLAAVRERTDAEPAGWAEALAHFDSCPRCRREALEADPLLVFRRLPVTELPAAAEAAEVDSMRQAVAAMRTARRLESRRSFAGWRRWAAAAVLALASLAVGWDKVPRETVPAPDPVASAPAAPRPAGTPTIEGLESPDARVYQINGGDLSAIMIVDNKLNV